MSLAYWSKLFIPTLREAPAGLATDGEKLLARAGYMRGDAYLFLGRKSLLRIEALIRREFASLDAQEILAVEGDSIAKPALELRSYKQLPQTWSQFHALVDLCRFDRTIEDSAVREVFHRILARCGVDWLSAESLTEVKLVVPREGSEDSFARSGNQVAHLCDAVGIPKPPSQPDPEGDLAPELFHTPNRKTIAELADFTGLPETSHIKSLVMIADKTPVLALLRGDHQLSTGKLQTAVRAVRELRPARADEIRESFGASAGSLGPIGFSGIRIFADESLRGRRNMIAGANRDDFHLRNVTPGKDFGCEFLDLRQAEEGEICPLNGEPLRFEPMEVLLTLHKPRINDALHVTDEAGREVPLAMDYGRLAVDRILWAVAEQHHDADGLVMPPEIAPFDVILTPVDYRSALQQEAASELIKAADKAGLDVLLDDRDERPGVKFKDADLIGIPWRITIGKKLEHGIVEVFERRTKQKVDVSTGEAIAYINTRR